MWHPVSRQPQVRRLTRITASNLMAIDELGD